MLQFSKSKRSTNSHALCKLIILLFFICLIATIQQQPNNKISQNSNNNYVYFNNLENTLKKPLPIFSKQQQNRQKQNIQKQQQNQQNPQNPQEQIVLQDSITDFLLGQQYNGQYLSLQNQSLFNYLDEIQGDTESMFYLAPKPNTNTYVRYFGLEIFNPKYHDLKVVIVRIQLKEDPINGKWERNNTQVTVEKIYKGRSSQGQQPIKNVNFTLQVTNINSGDASQVSISLIISGPDFQLTSNLAYSHNTLPTLGYCSYITFIVGLQIYCAVYILNQIDNQNPALIAKMSLLTLSICNIQDFYLTMLNIQYIMYTGTAYLLYVLPAIAYLVLFVVFDMKMLFLVWRSHHMRHVQDAQELRKKLTTFYIEFYVGLFIYLTLNYFFAYEGWLIFVQNMVMLPQIIHNVKVGNNPGFSAHYILGFLGLRFFIPFYERSCPQNHFSLQPMPVLVTFLALLYVVEISILFLQSKLGPRFFIPRIFLPNYFNYNVKLKLTQQNKDIDCSICLLNIFSPQPTNSSLITNNQSQINQQPLLLTDINIMKTPCGHYFHKECLTTWMNVKLECPSCRKTLPAV